MEFWLLLAGLGLGSAGTLVVALADAWLSRSILIYLDAVEANMAKVVETVRAGGTYLDVTGIDFKRDRGQNKARALKTLGWLALASGFVLQIVAAFFTRAALNQ